MNWKGGKSIDSHGYILLKVTDSLHIYNNGYVLEHRYIMEKFLNRLLKKEEIVHHINGIKSDNRIENLELLSTKIHKKKHGQLYTKNLIHFMYKTCKKCDKCYYGGVNTNSCPKCKLSKCITCKNFFNRKSINLKTNVFCSKKCHIIFQRKYGSRTKAS